MGIRAGQGFGAVKPKRKVCPQCGKRGVTDWQATPAGLARHCQYCQAAWGEAGWNLALAQSPAQSPMPQGDRVLTLALKGVYFDQIAAGIKTEEFRLATPFWHKRLVGREYDRVVITKGYPKASDSSRRLEFGWDGYQRRTLEHPHFGPAPVEVFAISLAKPLQALPAKKD